MDGIIYVAEYRTQLVAGPNQNILIQKYFHKYVQYLLSSTDL